jgi:hypothetical protein
MESNRRVTDPDALPDGHRNHRPGDPPMAWHQQVCRGDAKVCFIDILSIFRGAKSLTGWVAYSFYCYGSSKSPMQMSINEMVEWNAHLQTPVLFNHHEPYEVNSSSISTFDLNPIKSTPQAVANRERVLILTPLRDAAPYLPKYFDLLSELTYPHDLIDLAFLVGDSTDDTLAVLTSELKRVQDQVDEKIAFRSALVVQKDFGAVVDMDIEDKHSFKAQGPRRKSIARARNYLLYSALKPDHSWVYWRDVDIVDSPKKIIEDFVAHDKDVLVPSMYHSIALWRCIADSACRHLVPSLRKWSRH